jgi:hypothetical protein
VLPLLRCLATVDGLGDFDQQWLSEHCDALYEGTEDWMTVSGAPAGDWDHIITLVIDTTDMEPDNYTGWVRMESDCAACTRVNLEVLSPTGVDDTASWSRIKASY